MREGKLIGEAYRMMESAFDELRDYEKDGDPTHIRQASEKGWSAVVLVTDYLFAMLGILGYIQSRIPARRDMWTLYAHERRVLTKELEKHVETVKKEGLATKFSAFITELHGWGFYEDAIELEDLKGMLSEARKYIDMIQRILPELERRKDELVPFLIRRLEVRWKADEELAEQKRRLMEKYMEKYCK